MFFYILMTSGPRVLFQFSIDNLKFRMTSIIFLEFCEGAMGSERWFSAFWCLHQGQTPSLQPTVSSTKQYFVFMHIRIKICVELQVREEIGSSKVYMGTLLTVSKDLCVIAPNTWLVGTSSSSHRMSRGLIRFFTGRVPNFPWQVIGGPLPRKTLLCSTYLPHIWYFKDGLP